MKPAAPVGETGPKLRVAIVSAAGTQSLNASYGEADCNHALRESLSPLAHVETLDSPAADRLAEYDLCIYHLADDPSYGLVYRTALARPGLVILHQGGLHRLLRSVLPAEEYVEEFVFNSGEWMRDLAQRLSQQAAGAVSSGQHLEFPLIRRIVGTSRAVLVHNPRALRLAMEACRGEGKRRGVFRAPLYVRPPSLDEDTASAVREQLQIPADAVVISLFGPLQPERRVRTLLEAASALSTPRRVLLVGQFPSQEYRAALQPLLEKAQAIAIAEASERESWRLAAATDIGVDLSHPLNAETRTATLRLMALGKPVVVTDSEANSLPPASAVLRVDPGEAEAEMLAHFLYALSTDPQMRAAFGENARQYVFQQHSLEQVGAVYRRVVQECVAGAAAARSA